MEGLSIESLINDLALILVLGAVATVLFKKLKQPVVLGYIVAGFIASPHFSLFPSVAGEANIEFWGQIGNIVLLFSLGLEFSFKKLLGVGGSAVLTALIIVFGMMGLGVTVGEYLGFAAVDSLFLGGMISMSSTTIILKALTDLNMRQRRFVPMTFAVLIVEDLFAVVMMVVLSSIAIKKSVDSNEMLLSILKLSFFLIMWFTVGVFVLPSVFKRFKHIITDEMMLIMSMGLCFLMAVFSVASGFSLALGAFVMGSILAGTIEAERIERLVGPIKDLFGAVFFISVGMMVDPAVIWQYAGTIALLSVVVILGMIVFGTTGMLAAGQPLKRAMESGFALTQIGEFSFIIASLGMSLGVLQQSIYPIIVSVSVITTFTTPFFIKGAVPCYNALERHLPKTWTRLLNGYSSDAEEVEVSVTRRMWKQIVKRYLVRLLIYTVVTVALGILGHTYLLPLLEQALSQEWGRFVGVGSILVIVSPFLFAIMMPSIKRQEREALVASSGNVSYVPMVVMSIFSILVSSWLMVAIIYGPYSALTAIVSTIVLMLVMVLILSPVLRKRMQRMEERFIRNINEREDRRTGRANNLVNDLHLAYMNVGYGCPFVGEKMRNANLRQKYGVNVVSIQRGGTLYRVPGSEMRIFPGDVLGVIGNDEQIMALLPQVEAAGTTTASSSGDSTRFTHFSISEQSPLVGKILERARLREDYESLLVAVERGADNFVTLDNDFTFQAGDMLWIVGDPKRLEKLK